MSGALKRLSGSLFGRTALVLILTLVLSHAAAFALFSWAFRDGPVQQWAQRIATEVETQRGIWRVLTEAEREAYLHGHGGRDAQLRAEAPAELQPLGLGPQSQKLAAALRERLGQDIQIGRTPPPQGALWVRVLIGGRWLWLRQTPFGAGMPPLGGVLEGRPPQAEFAPGPPARPSNVAGPPPRPLPPPVPAEFLPQPARDPWMAAALVLVSASIGLLGTLALLWPLYRPLRRLSLAQAALGRGERVANLPTQGPYELAQLASGFNQMSDNLSALEDERRTLLAGVSHDLRTPLTRLRMRLALLDGTDTAPYERDLDDIERITEQFLAYVRGQADAGPIERVELASLLTEVAERYAPVCSLSLDAPAGLYAEIDKLAVLRALGNLIDNALSHGSAPIALSTRAEAERVCLQVRDHGPGMSEAELQAAPRPFHRLDPARRGHGHCGLGLAIAERVARRHGGELILRNAPGGGLLASLCLPGVQV